MAANDLRHRAVDDDDDGRPLRELPLWEPPLWDAKVALELIGKLVLVGVTDLAAEGAVPGQRQFHGYAIRADRRAGIVLRLEGAQAGEEVVLPPDTRVFRPAEAGRSQLCAAGGMGAAPDVLATWVLPARDESRAH